MLVNVKFHNGLINGLRNNWEWVHLVFDHREWLVTSYAFPLVAANWIRRFQTCEFPAGRFAHFRVYGDLKKKYFAFSFFNQSFSSRIFIYIVFRKLTWRFSTLLFSFLQIICGAWSLALSACTELHLSFWRLPVYYSKHAVIIYRPKQRTIVDTSPPLRCRTWRYREWHVQWLISIFAWKIPRICTLPPPLFLVCKDSKINKLPFLNCNEKFSNYGYYSQKHSILYLFLPSLSLFANVSWFLNEHQKKKKKLSNSYLLLKGITRITIFRFGIFSSRNHFSLLNFWDKWIRNVRKNAFRYIVNGKTVNNRTKSRKRSIAVRMTFRSVEIDTSFGRGLRNKRITGLDTVHL